MKLRDYQKNYLKDRDNKSQLIAWDMGLGKTCEALQLIPHEPGLSIVISPISASLTWPAETAKWRPDITLVNSVAMPPAKRKIKRKAAFVSALKYPTILLINYEQVKELLTFIGNFQGKFLTLIADESSYIKSIRAQRTRACLKLKRYAARRYALSGTPIQQGPLDLYSQLKFVHSSIIPESFVAFRNQYCVMGGFENHQVLAYKNLDELWRRLNGWVHVLKKENVATELPPKIYLNREVELNVKERCAYDSIKKEALQFINGPEPLTLTNALARIQKLQQAASGFSYYLNYNEARPQNNAIEYGQTKRQTVIDILQNDLAGAQVIVWSIYRYEQAALIADLTKTGIECNPENIEAIDAAQNFINGKYQVLVANPASLGYGLNLQCATAMIFCSHTYKYGDREQAEARCHRIGQTSPVTIIDLIAQNTIDKRILKIVDKKADLAALLVEELGVKRK